MPASRLKPVVRPGDSLHLQHGVCRTIRGVAEDLRAGGGRGGFLDTLGEALDSAVVHIDRPDTRVRLAWAEAMWESARKPNVASKEGSFVAEEA